MKKTVKDFLSGVGFAIVALIIVIVLIPKYVPKAMGNVALAPSAIVYISAGLILVCSLYMIASSIIHNKTLFTDVKSVIGQMFGSVEKNKAFLRVILALIIFFAYYFGFNTIGFYLSSLVAPYLLALLFGYKKYIKLAIIDIVVVTVLYWVFTTFFMVPLPGWSPLDLF